MVDLSILIPARNEMYLQRTVEGILKNIRGNTEILVGLDGEWADPPIIDDPRVTILYHNKSRGQRAMTNDLCRLSSAKWVMKIDAHCAVDEGFDFKMMEEMQGYDDWTMLPAMYNLHVFNWKCRKCGNEWYQAPTPTRCWMPGESRKPNEQCDNTTDFEKVMVWARREGRRSECYRFDTALHFQYHRAMMKSQTGDIVETMSAQGSCFMLTREKYWELNICDEEHGSWGQQGTEIACKTWLSGGRLVTNRRTWYAHLFRTQGGDFGFPFPLPNEQVNHARKYSQDTWLNNKWEKQKYPLSWLIDKFAPLPEWHEPNYKKILESVRKKGKTFMTPSKGIIFYTDNKVNHRLSHAVQDRLREIELPITSCSLKPMAFGNNIVLKEKRGVLTMFKQILTALENAKEDVVFFCEHDVIYHPSHFLFTPERHDVFYYNTNVWKVDQKTGKALHYDTKQVSGICVWRTTAIAHYRKRIAMVEKDGYTMRMGYEPGTHRRPERVDDLTSQTWVSEFPNVDVRHGENLSPTRWKKEEFRNQKYTEGWTEGDIGTIPGWEAYNFSRIIG